MQLFNVAKFYTASCIKYPVPWKCLFTVSQN